MSCRGVCAGVNAGTMNFIELRAVGIESCSHDMGRVRAFIDEAKAETGWLISFTHDVHEQPTPHGCRPEDLEDVIQALADAHVTTLPLRDVATKVLAG